MQNRQALEQIRRETPKLLAPIALYMSIFGTSGDPAKYLKQHLRCNFVSEAAFKLLAKHGVRPFRYLLAYYRHRPLVVLESALKLCHGGNSVGFPPPAMQKTVAEIYARNGRGDEISVMLRLVPPQLLQAARERFHAANSKAARDRTACEFLDILNWLRRNHNTAVPIKARRLTRWNSWLKYARLDLHEREQAQRNVSWPCHTGDFELHGVRVRTLSDSLSLFRESRSMRHCVENYINECVSGGERYFHAEAQGPASIQRVTIGLRRVQRGGDVWRVIDVRGPCNAHPGRAWRRFAEQLAVHYNAAGQSVQRVMGRVSVDLL